jgi:Ser/Thr protein kinase RdoA (MazF antagonist)
VVKLFKPGVSPRVGKHEMRTSRAAFSAGAPTAEVLGDVKLDGRFGILLARFDGASLAQKMLTGAITYEETGTILAGLYFALHQLKPSTDVASFRDWIAHASRQSRDTFPEHLAEGVLALLDRLPEGDALCHCDLHPGNVIITADGPKIIDWVCAVRAPGIVDIGRCHVTLTELVLDDVDPDLPRRINEAVQTEYARLAGISRGELTSAMEPYLPILRALVFLQQRPATPAQRERLLQRIAAALLSEG